VNFDLSTDGTCGQVPDKMNKATESSGTEQALVNKNHKKGSSRKK
jgi:hypothetical protein